MFSNSQASKFPVMLEPGEDYKITTAWAGKIQYTEVKFEKVTPKGFAFMKPDGKRLYPRLMYPDKRRLPQKANAHIFWVWQPTNPVFTIRSIHKIEA